MAKEFYVGKDRRIPWDEVPGVMSFTYADVMLLQQLSDFESRKEADQSEQLGPYTLRVPVMTAPMDTITGEKMIRKMAELGGIGTLPRGDLEKNLALCEQFSRDGVPCIYSVGLGQDTVEQIAAFQDRGGSVFLIDIANGAMQKVIRAASETKNRLGGRGKGITLIAGNISNYPLAQAYKESGAIDIARVGVGPGGACWTRKMTGIGMPQFAAVLDTSEAGIAVIADGAIKEPSDVCKALGAGAKFVMIGSWFGGTHETPGDILERTINGETRFFKIVRGQASKSYMDDHGIEITDWRAAEGLTVEVPVDGLVGDIVREIKGGLASSMSYVGAHNLQEFREKAVFIQAGLSAQGEGGRLGRKS